MPGDFGFLWPYAVLALPLPWLLRRWLGPARVSSGALWVPVLSDYTAAAGNSPHARARWPLWVASLVWCLLVLAVMRPVWINTTQRVPLTGRDLWVAVDLSTSMGQTDFELDGHRVARLKAAKKVAKEFIAGRRGDRVGLLVFGTHAYIQAPLTLDRRTVQILLDQAHVGMAGGKTAIGDAIGLAVKHAQAAAAAPAQQVLVLLSDGDNTAGTLQPDVAARLAAQQRLKIYTIGLSGTPYADKHGLAQLRRIAGTTHGAFALASSTAMLKRAFSDINRLQPASRPESVSLYTALFPWPLGAALLIVLLVSAPWPRLRTAASL